MRNRNYRKTIKRLGIGVTLAMLVSACGTGQVEQQEQAPSKAELANEAIADLINESDSKAEIEDFEPPEFSDEILKTEQQEVGDGDGYFFEAYEYGLRTSDVAPLQEIFAKDCTFCDLITEMLEENSEKGYAYPHITFGNEIWVNGYDNDDGNRVVIYRSQLYDSVKENDAGRVPSSSPDEELFFFLIWGEKKNGWKLVDGAITPDDPYAED